MRYLMFVFALALTLPTLAEAKTFNGNELKGKYVCQEHGNGCRNFKVKDDKIIFKGPKCVVPYTRLTATDAMAIILLSLDKATCNPGFDFVIFMLDDNGELHVGVYLNGDDKDLDHGGPERIGIYTYKKV